VIFLLWALIMAIAMRAYCFTGEPASPVKPSARFVTHLKSGIALLKTDVDYRRFYVVRVCWQFTAMAFPFYVSFAYDELGMPVSLVGLFLAIWVGSGVFSNYFWGRMLDGVGNKMVLFVTAVMSVLPPLIVLALQARSAGEGALPAGWTVTLALSSTFFINGMARSGRIISHLTYPLEIAPESDRPLYVGFLNSATFPFMLSPLLGGVIIEAFDMRTLFVVCLVSAVVNAALSLTLREPRKTDI
jgi:MFS family permease